MRDSADQVETSVIVVSYNVKELLRLCVQSIYDYPPTGSLEVIVVDNASSDGSSEMVSSSFPEVRLLPLNSNRGYAYACNYGAESSRGRLLLFLNSDIEVTPGALLRLQNCVQETKEPAICSGRLLSYDGSVQPSCRRFPNHLSILFSRGSFLSKLPLLRRLTDRYLIEPPQGSLEVDSIAGACLLVRREVFDQLGGFDQQFFMYLEDIDLCYRLRKMGGAVLFVSEAVFRHRWGASSDTEKLRSRLEHHRSVYRYFKKHYPRKALSNLSLAIMLLAQLGSIFFVSLLTPQSRVETLT